MRYLYSSLAVLLVGGCVSHMRSLQLDSGRLLCCPADQVSISDFQPGLAGFRPATWTATGCARERACHMAGGGDNAYRVWCPAGRDGETWQNPDASSTRAPGDATAQANTSSSKARMAAQERRSATGS